MANHLPNAGLRGFVRQLPTARHCNCSDCAGIDEALHACFTRGTDQITCSDDIVVINLVGISCPQPIVRSNMENLSHTFERFAQRRRIAQVPIDALTGQTFIGAEGGCRSNKNSDMLYSPNQHPCNVVPHESSRSCN